MLFRSSNTASWNKISKRPQDKKRGVAKKMHEFTKTGKVKGTVLMHRFGTLLDLFHRSMSISDTNLWLLSHTTHADTNILIQLRQTVIIFLPSLTESKMQNCSNWYVNASPLNSGTPLDCINTQASPPDP